MSLQQARGQDPLLSWIASETPSPRFNYVLVAVDGPDGSGKTTFAVPLAEELRRQGRDAVVIHADHFLNLSGIRYRRGRWSPEGSGWTATTTPRCAAMCSPRWVSTATVGTGLPPSTVTGTSRHA